MIFFPPVPHLKHHQKHETQTDWKIKDQDPEVLLHIVLHQDALFIPEVEHQELRGHTHTLRHCSRLTGLFRSLLFFLKSLQKTSLSSSLPYSSSSSSLALFSKCFSQHFLFFFCKWFKADLRSASFACLLVDWGLRAWPVSSMRREPHCHCHMSQFLIFYSSVSDLHLKQMFPHTELWQWELYFKTCDELF